MRVAALLMTVCTLAAQPFHLEEATIGDVHAAYRSGALTAAGLVQVYLERIQQAGEAALC
jgi:Asp-tRNA(Asn)/Glu-tRNA(Gln) amidotransferase A subunit family amidase